MTVKRHTPGREPGAHQGKPIESILRSRALQIELMLSIDDLAVVLSCSRRLVERMRSSGKVPKPDLYVGRCPRWRPETVRSWIGEGADARPRRSPGG